MSDMSPAGRIALAILFPPSWAALTIVAHTQWNYSYPWAAGVGLLTVLPAWGFVVGCVLIASAPFMVIAFVFQLVRGRRTHV